MLNPRGPVFTFPKQLRQPIDLRGSISGEVFEQALDMFLQAFPSPPARKVLRIGLVRRLLFGTGKTDCGPWLARNVLDFGTANLTGAQTVLVYKDEGYNVVLTMAGVQVNEQTAVPVMGQVVSTISQNGLAVSLDINNGDVRELDATARHAVVEKATSFWPRELLSFLNQRRLP
jgi:hypothetical protein